MENENVDSTQYILESLIQKSLAKQEAYTVTLEHFFTFKKVMNFLIENYQKQLESAANNISLDFSENGVFEASMQVAGDMIVFNMHSNIFAHEPDHWIWKTDYIQEDNLNGYVGVINVYNFLADSFKYQRLGDFGYIVARIFINREGYYFLEGNPDFGSFNDHFGKQKLDMSLIREIIQHIIIYSLEVDLTVPPLENIQFTTVENMLAKQDKTKVDTGKPLGFRTKGNK
jgi:hypothetical protein